MNISKYFVKLGLALLVLSNFNGCSYFSSEEKPEIKSRSEEAKPEGWTYTSNQQTQSERQYVENRQIIECPFPNSPNVAAPNWICDNYEDIDPDNTRLYATGSAFADNPNVRAGAQSQLKELASARALTRIGRSMETITQSMIIDYFNLVGMGKSQVAEAVANTTAKQVSDQTIEGARLIRSLTGPDGTIYVLLMLDNTGIKQNVKNSVRTTFNNDQALYQEFKASRSLDEMDAAIDKMKINPRN